MVSDNAGPFISSEFKDFAKEYKFSHVTSSLDYLRSNGLAEKGVQTAKKMVLKSLEEKKDFREAIFIYNNTPQEFDLASTSQSLLSKRGKTWTP